MKTTITAFFLTMLVFLLLACDSSTSQLATSKNPLPLLGLNSQSLDEKVAGKINGEDFSPEKSTLHNSVLELGQGTDFFADCSLSIFLFLEDGKIS